MQQVREHDRHESTTIEDAIKNNPEIQSSSYSTTASTCHTRVQSLASSEQDQDQDQEEEGCVR
jgi:hypothetical protein